MHSGSTPSLWEQKGPAKRRSPPPPAIPPAVHVQKVNEEGEDVEPHVQGEGRDGRVQAADDGVGEGGAPALVERQQQRRKLSMD